MHNNTPELSFAQALALEGYGGLLIGLSIRMTNGEMSGPFSATAALVSTLILIGATLAYRFDW